MCGRQNIALRGHRDCIRDESANKGNFNAILEYRSEGDSELRDHLQNSAKNSRYTSWRIQNEIIDICGNILTRKIVGDVDDFFTVIADETADCSNKEQLALIIRFISKHGYIREEFLRFLECREGVTGQQIAKEIITGLKMAGLCLEKLRGQGYDGAGSMAGKVKGAAAIISQQYPKAVYTHCCSHVLNLAIMAASQIPMVRNMFGLVDRVYIFFDSHPKRQNSLDAAITSECPEARRKRLKSLCRTRWIERHHALETFLDLYPAIVKCFVDIYNPSFDNPVSWNRDSVVDAKALYLSLTAFDHIISLVVVQYCMSFVKGLTVLLQSKANDIVKACSAIDGVKVTMAGIREDVENQHTVLFKKAVDLGLQFEVTPSLPRTCGRQTNRNNTSAENPEIYYRRVITIPYLDYLIVELDMRFSDHQTKAMKALTIIPSILVTDIENYSQVQNTFTDMYEDDLPSPRTFHAELLLWKHHWQAQDTALLPSTPSEALCHASKLAYPNINTLLKILCVLPVTTCEAERSFSSLKLLKTHLRSTMGQSRLNGLALLHIHNKTPPAVDDILAEFIGLHKRRMELGFIDIQSIE
ncbi:52 kDa repressor of the inhibitor of the protein kinase-like [Mixophyes fleayi]|uniref:52 kDa repressor of the inhibitor of the protein kinase-like n=1 Tax=Mixophyes fleayi TaxID=3061075 RepID=UPI003F4D93DA